MAYLDYAGIGRIRPAAEEALRAAVEALAAGAAEYGGFFTARNRCRELAARLLECDPDEIALVSNTSAGLHLVADGMQWRPGDEIVVCDRDFPANVHPWRRLASRGVRLRLVPMRDGGYDLDELAAQVNRATRLIAVSHVNFVTGYRIDLAAVCALAQETGALVCVDAAQSLGALPVSVRRAPVDFLAAGGHKWLCGPPGTGMFYCRRDRLDLLTWAAPGWFGYDRAQDMLVLGEEGHFTYDLPLRQSARRFEGGMPNLLGLVGLAEALAEIETVGIDTIAQRVLALGERLRAGLRELGYPPLGPGPEPVRSGIVSFRSGAAGALHAALTEAGVQCSCPDGKLRLAPHYWTTDAEIERVLAELKLIGGTPRR